MHDPAKTHRTTPSRPQDLSAAPSGPGADGAGPHVLPSAAEASPGTALAWEDGTSRVRVDAAVLPQTSANSSADQGGAGEPGFWRRRSWRQTLESWSSSMLVHAVVLVVLATISIAVPRPAAREHLLQVIDRPAETLNARLDESTAAAESVSFVATSGGIPGETHARPLKAAGELKLDRQAAQVADAPRVTLADVSLLALPGQELNHDLDMQSPGEPSAPVAGYGAAMDRITQELVLLLAQGKALVIWLFDQSASMKNDQQEVQERIRRVYEELGLAGKDQGDALLTAVASFGGELAVHTRRPTSNPAQIEQAIRDVPVDDTGRETFCASVMSAIEQHQKYGVQGKRQLVLVVVSDESGDDGEGIEEAIAAARSANCRVYVLGREAVFGYPYAHVRYVEPEKGYEYWLAIRRGPETPFVEALQTDGLWPRRDAHPSGFGPYEQVRLCRETGGVFFMLPSLENDLVAGEKRIYAIEAMRPYLPDLSSREEYLQERVSRPLRAGLAEVVESLDPNRNRELELAWLLPIDPAAFAQAVESQQTKAREYLALLELAESRLNSLERERQHEPSPRWQANFDLMLAQVLACRVRAYEFGAYLEAFRASPKLVTDAKSNHWRVEFVAQPRTGAEAQAIADRATSYFRQVRQRHPGTPYAARAEWELSRGYSVELFEYYHPPDYDQVKLPSL